jgi:hypothetical protein
MAGSCIIDGFDIGTIGMFIMRGGDFDLLTFPDRKEPNKNNWFEYDGDDVDLSEVYLNAKKTTIKFYLNAVSGAQFITRINAFENLISASGYRSVYIKEFNRTFTLRYVGCTSFPVKGGLIKPGAKSAQITVEFMDDTPTSLFTSNLVPYSTLANDTYVKLNGIEFKYFGITIKKIYDSALSIHSVKQGLVQIIERMTGQMVDVAFTPKKQARKLTIDCYMKAASLTEFYLNYNALFNNLTLPQALTITINNNTDIKCYYNSMNGWKTNHSFSTGILIEFTLNLTEVFS